MRSTSALLLVVLASTGPSGAAAAAGGPRALHWSDVVRLVDDDPRIGEARFRTAEARAALELAGAVPNPSLEALIGHSVSADPAGRPDLGLALTLPLDWLNDRGYRLEAASAEARAAELEALAARLEALGELRALFLTAAVDRARVAQLEQLEAQTAELARLVTLRVERGESRPIEQPRAEVELEKVRLELAGARGDEATHRRQLGLWLGGLESSGLLVEADLSLLPGTPGLEEALAEAAGQHPALAAARARVGARAAEIGAERRKRLPRFSLTAFAEQEPDRRVYGGGVGVELPLWNWNSAGIRRAEAARAAEEQRVEARGRELGALVVAAHGACLQAGDAAARYRELILPRVEKASATLERTYELGETGLLDVIDARRTLLEARRDGLDATLAAQLECARLQTLLGKEIP